jgi:excinuclease UvrABC nuclease subunit
VISLIYDYQGHYSFNSNSVSNNAPESWGVYYCGYLNQDNILITLYVGRAAGEGVNIKSRLLDHLRENKWPDVTHFGYKECTTQQEAINLETNEIKRLNQPKYNMITHS